MPAPELRQPASKEPYSFPGLVTRDNIVHPESTTLKQPKQVQPIVQLGAPPATSMPKPKQIPPPTTAAPAPKKAGRPRKII